MKASIIHGLMAEFDDPTSLVTATERALIGANAKTGPPVLTVTSSAMVGTCPPLQFAGVNQLLSATEIQFLTAMTHFLPYRESA